MMTTNGDEDRQVLWNKESSIFLSPVSLLRRWLFPVLISTVVLILIVVLGVSNMKMSDRLLSAQQSVSNLSDIVQSLNTSLQHVQESAKEARRLQLAVDNNSNQLITVMEAMKQLSEVDSLNKKVASLKCSLEHIVNNRSVGDGCCPVGWEQFNLNCFFFSTSARSWNESRVSCEEHGAHLYILRDSKEWAFVNRHTVPEFYWVGLSWSTTTGRWEWVNQTPYKMERRHWQPAQPDRWVTPGLGPESCVHLHSTGRLNDLQCSVKLQYVCQKHSVRE